MFPTEMIFERGARAGWCADAAWIWNESSPAAAAAPFITFPLELRRGY
jgi:hypothetical protein